MNPPRIIKEIPPVTGPVVSPIQASEKGLLIPNNGTLPPVCVVTGETLPLRSAQYVLTYLSVCGENSYGAEDSAAYRVKLPYKNRNLAKLSRLIWIVQALLIACIGWLVFFGQSIMFDSFSNYLIATLLVWLMPKVHALMNRRLTIYCSGVTGSRIEVCGIPTKVMIDMLKWQAHHLSTNPN